jgi:predicted DCC family thiol-disulfide oxidoreductase YuxK
LPTAWLDRLYDIVARNRYRAFGRGETCLTPRPEYRNRFVESQKSNSRCG